MASGLIADLFRVRSVDDIVAEAEAAEHGVEGGEAGALKRSMGLLALTFFSVGSIIGTGIFVILGEAVPKAGPAVLLSFVLAGITCAFSALSYAELASTIPVSGSSYSYAYATLGELIAWVCGWCLMLEYGVSVAAVAVGWGQYLNEFLSSFNLEIPPQLANPPGEYGGSGCPPGFDPTTWVGDLPDKCAAGVFNVPSLLVVVLCGLLLVRGTSESAKVNTAMVFLKLGILAFFCVIAFTQFDPSNLTPFLPLGMAGVSAAASQVFFSYIGFDAASTAGEEAKNPRRDLPRAIILSLVIVTICYLLVALAAIGARPWQDFEGAGGEAVLASIARDVTGSDWAPALIALGAVVSIFSVVLTVMYGQTRILFAMGRDGLLPKVFTRVNPRTMVPTANTWIVTAAIAVLAALVPLGQLAEATSIGTLFAFGIVNIGVIVLRRSRPDLQRSFHAPLFPLTPILGIGCIIWVMSGLAGITWLVFGLWMLGGLIVYFLYGFRHSKLRTTPATAPAPTG